MHYHYRHERQWSGNTSNAAFLLSHHSNGTQREVSLQSVETIVNLLLDVMTYGAFDQGIF